MRLAELKQAIRATDPAAILVPKRVVNRLIQGVCKLPMLMWQVPHSRCFVVDRQVLFRFVDQDELELDPEQSLPRTVILLAQPSQEELSAQTRDAVLLDYWRLLFHANLHAAFEERLREGTLTLEAIRDRIDRVGQAEFAEARRVLHEDHWLPLAATDDQAFIEFAAVYLELRYFAANLLPTYFPGIHDLQGVERLLRQDLDVDVIFTRTRLAKAPEPVVRTDPRSDESNDYYWKLIRHAERVGKAGNTVRAAILRTKAARVAPAALTMSTRQDADAELQKLTDRLRAALQLSDAEVTEWMQVLPALLDKADQGNQPVEAALLFDLQKACLDHERTIYALDLVEWALSGGKRPIMRPLPSQRLVRIIKHLRSASLRLTQARLTDADREHLGMLLQTGQTRSQERLRERLRPVLHEAINDVGLRPENPPERTAFLKVIEELLDRIIEYGFLTFGDLRDAISRNQLKLSDPADAQEFVRGDPLLRLDRRLSSLLDGVYRASEFYLRWMERFTALSFGTETGRKLTRYVAVPFGGAAMAVYGWDILLQHVSDYQLRQVTTWTSIAVLGSFILGLVNFPRFREGCRRTAIRTGRAIRTLCVDWPARLAAFKPLREFVSSWPFQLFYWYLLKPLAASAVVWWLVTDLQTPLGAALVFLVANFILNSRPGKAATEIVTQALVRFFELLKEGLVQGLYRQILHLFKQIVDAIQYVLFTVDEWLRYRSGDNKVTMVLQTILGALWYPISFVARFYMIVLIEPGFNPIKAPVSILFAKIVYPLSVTYILPITDALTPFLGRVPAGALVFSTAWLLPDAFTFLLWEMKGNWRLYRANRQPQLTPVAIGPHGETVRRLLQPGFHSGTVPKLYSRLRQAERDAAVTGNWRAARVSRRSLQDVEKSLQRLVSREMAPLLDPYLGGVEHGFRAGRIELSSNRIRIELTNAAFADEPACLEWLEEDGWLVASIRERAWLDRLDETSRQAVTTALAGLYKLAGIDVVTEQVRANLPRPVAAFELAPRDLVLWLDHRHGKAVLYDLNDLDGRLRPHTESGKPLLDWPVLDDQRVIFSRLPISWDQWVENWRGPAQPESKPVLRRIEVEVLPNGQPDAMHVPHRSEMPIT